MAETKLKPDKAKEGEEKAPAAPAVGVVLELYFPLTKAILPTNYITEGEAVRAAFAHFTAFPTG